MTACSWSRAVLVGLAAIVGTAWMCQASHAQHVSQLPACTAESTGLKYVNVEGSGFASMFFVIPLLALAPVAGTLASNSQYGCHVAVIGSDAAGAYRKVHNRPKVAPY